MGKDLRVNGPDDTVVEGDIITDNGNSLAGAGEDGGHTVDRLLNERLVNALAEVDNLRVAQQRLVNGGGRVLVLALEAELLGAGSSVLHRRHGGNLAVLGGGTTTEGGVGGGLSVLGGIDDHVAASINAGEDAGVGVLVDAGEVVEAILLERVDEGVGGNDRCRRQGEEDVTRDHCDGISFLRN